MADELIDAAKRAGAVPEGYEPVNVDFFQFKTIGDNLTGRLIGKRDVIVGKGQGSKTGKYTIVNQEGKIINFLGSIDLDEKLGRVPVGAHVFIRYSHDEKVDSSGFDMKRFEVYQKRIQ